MRRLTIAGTMGLVALMAVGLASLRRPTPLAASAAFSLAVAILLGAIVASISLRGRARAVWGSFAACGVAYLALALAPWSTAANGPHPITVPLIDHAYSMSTNYYKVINIGIPNYTNNNIEVKGYWVTPQAPWTRQTSTFSSQPYLSDFSGSILIVPWALSRIAHSMLCLVVAAAGGLFSLWLTGHKGIDLATRAGNIDPTTPSTADRP